jgi:hypothetical protein
MTGTMSHLAIAAGAVGLPFRLAALKTKTI